MLQRDIVRIILVVAAVGAGASAFFEGSGLLGFLRYALILGSCASSAAMLTLLAARRHWFRQRWQWSFPLGFSRVQTPPQQQYYYEAPAPPLQPPPMQEPQRRIRAPIGRPIVQQPHRVRAGRIQHDDARIPPGGAA